MKNCINVDILSNLNKVEVHSILLVSMPDFSWRMGDSDMQGGYVSGRNEAGIYIQCWTDESPHSFTISFSSASLDEASKATLVNHILQDVLPTIGKVEKID